jgi:hypothetical protein
MALNINDEVAAMRQMTSRELREKYAEVFGEESHSRHKQFLIKRIAWRMQANEEGDLSERARRRAMELADDADLRLNAPRRSKAKSNGHRVSGTIKRTHDDRVPMPGSTLTREYKGRTVRVHVLENGYEHDGVKYPSLSAAAKAITGSHTSGFLFFRLNGKGGRK